MVFRNLSTFFQTNQVIANINLCCVKQVISLLLCFMVNIDLM